MIDQQAIRYYTADEALGATATLTPMAARILLFLFLQEPGVSFTGKSLAARYGVSKQTISAAIGNLETSGFVQNNGKNHGWSLLPKFKQMTFPFVDNSRNEVQKFLNQPEVSSKIFESSPPPLVVDDLTLNSEREEQQQSIKSAEGSKIFELSPEHRPQGNAGSGATARHRPQGNAGLVAVNAALLRRIGVRGMALRQFSTPPCPNAAIILAWWYESLTMALGNPPGWIICRLRAEDVPGDNFLDLARFWLTLDADGRDGFNEILDTPGLGNWKARDLASEFDLSQAAAELAVQLRPLKAFEE